MDRAECLLRGIERETMYGIEIGPFFNPIAPKAKGWKTVTVDFADQAALLRTARNHEASVICEMADNIEPVDVVWRDCRLDEACLKIRPEGFDYLIASHVIEHLPDLVEFFKQIAALARRDHFILSLAVPDCRLTFDFFKPLSNTANVLQAHREQRKLHAPETLFDAFAYQIHQNGIGCWIPNSVGILTLPYSLDVAHRKYIHYLLGIINGSQAYLDAHCWYWTPSSFELMVLELNHLGYIDFSVTESIPGDGSEFLTKLRIGEHGLSPDQLHARRLDLMKRTRRELADGVQYLD